MILSGACGRVAHGDAPTARGTAAADAAAEGGEA